MYSGTPTSLSRECSTSPDRMTWRNSAAYASRMTCMSSCARDRMSVPNGKWADCPGGYSSKKDIRLRESDPYFMERVGIFEKSRCRAGSWYDHTERRSHHHGTSRERIRLLRGRQRLRIANPRHRTRNYPGVALFQCDWASNFTKNGLHDLVWTMNFGTGANIDQQFAPLKKLRPDSPLMCSEFWSGWALSAPPSTTGLSAGRGGCWISGTTPAAGLVRRRPSDRDGPVAT